MKSIAIILGTRPEAIKLAPVILAIKGYSSDFTCTICNTEQQKELSSQTLSFFDIRPDICLDSMTTNQSLAEIQSIIMKKLHDVFSKDKFDMTFVQGDTMSAFCGALVSFYHKTPVCHIEAGLRSDNIYEPFPEEAIRQLISRIASFHFCPTESSKHALLKDGIQPNKIFVTGNTCIDALFALKQDTLNNAEQELLSTGLKFEDNIVLITVHRRENHGERLQQILSAIKTLSNKFQDHQFIVPLHPNPNVQSKIQNSLEQINNIILTSPLNYAAMVLLMKLAKLIMTDSGGIQEEAPTFNVPTLVLRHQTERVEGIACGATQMAGTESNKIISLATPILRKSFVDSRLHNIKNPYGDGRASQRILSTLLKY